MEEKEQLIYDFVRNELKDDLIPKDFSDRKIDSPFYGHCHHATIAMYNLLGGKRKGYSVRKAVDKLDITHYWLETKNGHIIDPTAEQYTDLVSCQSSNVG